MKKVCVLFFFLLWLGANAQVGTNPNYEISKSVIALQGGYQYFRYHGIELGLAHARYSRSGKMSYGRGFGLSGEIFADSVPAYGPKISAWMCGGGYHISLGANAGYYLNRNGSTLRICPQVGVGGKRWRVNYGYSFALTGADFLPANTHTISVNVLLDLFTLEARELGADKTMQKKK